MSEFISPKPNPEIKQLAGFFKGGMMPVEPTSSTGLIVFDVRRLQLTKEQGSELEEKLRAVLFEYASQTVENIDKFGASNLSGSVFGIAID